MDAPVERTAPPAAAPDGRLPDLPPAPEHVAACYLVALAGRGDLIRDEWRAAFKAEARGRLDWSADRNRGAALGAFLSRFRSPSPLRLARRGPSPIVRVLEKLAGEKLAGEKLAGGPEAGDLRVVSWAHRAAFMELWGAGDGATGLPGVVGNLARDGVKTLVIVWDGAPALDTGPVDTTRFLSPLDWAVALGCELARAPVAGLDLAVWILRPFRGPEAAGPTEGFVEGLPRQQLPSLLWVRHVRIPERDGDANGPRALVAALSRGRPEERVATAGAAASGPPAVRGILTAALTQPSDDASHNDVANLLGPQRLLREEDCREPKLRDVLPLRRLAQSLDLFPSDAREPETIRLGQRFGRRLSVYLVDDLWRLGWGAVFRRAFGVDGAARKSARFELLGESDAFRLFATDSGDAVLEALGKGVDQRFAFTLGIGATEELAVLDLRLFGGRPLEAEARFYRELVRIGRAQRAWWERPPGPRQAPWPLVDADELDRVDSWCARVAAGEPATRQEAAALEGMTLLPRLVALADPSYPVIVFSSTSRRIVEKKLQPYRNVLTAVEKPQVSALRADDLALRLKSGLLDALQGAAELGAVRRSVASLPTGAKAEIPTGTAPKTPTAAGGIWTAEVLLDETGGDDSGHPLAVGGLVAVYPPGSRPAVWDTGLWERFPGLGQAQREDHRAFKDELREQLEDIAGDIEAGANAGRQPIRIAAVACREPREHSGDQRGVGDALFDLTAGDNLHRELVRGVLEGAIYDVARRLLPADVDSGRVRLEVRLATRVKNIPEEMCDPDGRVTTGFKEEMWNNLGIRIHELPRRDLIDCLNEGDARPLVEEVVGKYRESSFSLRTRVAVGVRLNQSVVRRYGWKDSIPYRARLLHYVADALLVSPWVLPEPWWRRGFGRPTETPEQGRDWTCSYDRNLRAFLGAQRHLLTGRKFDAVAAVMEAERQGSPQNPLIRRIQGDLREAAGTLRGAEIQRLARNHGRRTTSWLPREPVVESA